jgi:hypothetical protein
MTQNNTIIKKAVTLGELVVIGFGLFGVVLTFWISTSVRLSSVELEQKNMQTQIDRQEQTNNKIQDKLDKVLEEITNLKVAIQNKQDKK